MLADSLFNNRYDLTDATPCNTAFERLTKSGYSAPSIMISGFVMSINSNWGSKKGAIDSGAGYSDRADSPPIFPGTPLS